MITGEASSLHRGARVVAFVFSVIGGLAVSSRGRYIRSTEVSHLGRAGLRGGLSLVA